MIRQCKKCGDEKDISCFVKKKKSDGIEYYLNTCLDCNREYHKQYNTKYYQSHRDKLIVRSQQWYLSNIDEKKEYDKEYSLKNKENKQEYDKAYRFRNKVAINIRLAKYRKERRKNDPLYKIRKNISFGIWSAIKKHGGIKNNKSVLDFLPYSIEDLKQHLEKQFESWMTWDNYGSYDMKTWIDTDVSTWTWQLDHIIPQSFFKYHSMDDSQFFDCWALSNLRPYSAKQNVKDSNRR
jgi:hypothetical protein